MHAYHIMIIISYIPYQYRGNHGNDNEYSQKELNLKSLKIPKCIHVYEQLNVHIFVKERNYFMHNFSDTGNVQPKQALFNIFRHNRIIHCTFNKVLKNI
jgi:hypothetical protein